MSLIHLPANYQDLNENAFHSISLRICRVFKNIYKRHSSKRLTRLLNYRFFQSNLHNIFNTQLLSYVYTYRCLSLFYTELTDKCISKIRQRKIAQLDQMQATIRFITFLFLFFSKFECLGTEFRQNVLSLFKFVFIFPLIHAHVLFYFRIHQFSSSFIFMVSCFGSYPPACYTHSQVPKIFRGRQSFYTTEIRKQTFVIMSKNVIFAERISGSYRLTLMFVFKLSPYPSFSKTAMYVKSKHMKGWSVFAVAHTSFALATMVPTATSPPSNGSVYRISEIY